MRCLNNYSIFTDAAIETSVVEPELEATISSEEQGISVTTS